MTQEKKKYHNARFTARYVPMLAKWAMSDDEYARAFYTQGNDTTGLQIEPAEEGGVYLTATNGVRIAVVHDKAGSCDTPVILSLPEEFIDACRPNVGPQAVPPEDGCPYQVKLPEWMQPRDVLIHWEEKAEDCEKTPFWVVMVTGGKIPKEYREDNDQEDGSIGFYKSSCLHSSWRDAQPSAPSPLRPLVPGRRILARQVDPTPVTTITAQAQFLADLLYLGEVCELTFDKVTGAIRAEFVDAPEIKAAIMPMLGRTPEERERAIEAHDRQIRERDLARLPAKGAVQ